MKHKPLKCPPFFIIGMPRSGTTLLSVILNAHSLTTVIPETHYFYRFWKYCERHGCLANEVAFKKFIEYFFQNDHSKLNFSNLEREEIISEILAKKIRSHSAILDATFSFYARKNGKSICGDKTPENIFYMNRILKIYPIAKIIHIVRDPRDVILSISNHPHLIGHTKNIVGYLDRWKKAMQMPKRCSFITSSNYYEIKYEDLLEKPHKTIERVCTFLNIPYEPEMLEYHVKNKPNFNVMIEPWKAKALKEIDPMNKNKWKIQMTKEKCFIVDLLASKELTNKGYEKSKKGFSLKGCLELSYFMIENLIQKLMFYNKRIIQIFFEYVRYGS